MVSGRGPDKQSEDESGGAGWIVECIHRGLYVWNRVFVYMHHAYNLK